MHFSRHLLTAHRCVRKPASPVRTMQHCPQHLQQFPPRHHAQSAATVKEGRRKHTPGPPAAHMATAASPAPYNNVQRCMSFFLAIPSESYRSRFRLLLYFTVLILFGSSLLTLILLCRESSFIFTQLNSSKVGGEVSSL